MAEQHRTAGEHDMASMFEDMVDGAHASIAESTEKWAAEMNQNVAEATTSPSPTPEDMLMAQWGNSPIPDRKEEGSYLDFEKRGNAHKERDARGPNSALGPESRPELSEDEKAAAVRYTATYEDLNRALNKGEPLHPRDEKIDRALRMAFAKCKPFPEPVTVSRGIYLYDQEAAKFMESCKQALETGSEVLMPAYSSTTTHIPDELGRTYFGGTHALEMTCKYGIDLKPISLAHTENELLIDRGSRFRVTKIEQTLNGPMIHMEQLNDKPTVPLEPEKKPAKKRSRWWLFGKADIPEREEASKSRFVGTAEDFVFEPPGKVKQPDERNLTTVVSDLSRLIARLGKITGEDT